MAFLHIWTAKLQIGGIQCKALEHVLQNSNKPCQNVIHTPKPKSQLIRIGHWFPSINQSQPRILFRMLIYNQKYIEPTSKISRHNQYAFSPMMQFRIFISFILIIHLRHWLLRLNFVFCCIGTFKLIQPKNQANQLYPLLNIKLVCLTSYGRTTETEHAIKTENGFLVTYPYSKTFLENQFQKFLIAYNSVITWRYELGTQDQAAIQLASEKQTRNVYISF